jgi:hypothetical protein
MSADENKLFNQSAAEFEIMSDIAPGGQKREERP